VSLQLSIVPPILPNCTLPAVAPKPVPAMLTEVPAGPDSGVTLVMCGMLMVNGFALLMMQPCRIMALPDAAPIPTVATTWVSLQDCTTALTVPSHTWPVPWAAPKPLPVMLTRRRFGGMIEEIDGHLSPLQRTNIENPSQAAAKDGDGSVSIPLDDLATGLIAESLRY